MTSSAAIGPPAGQDAPMLAVNICYYGADLPTIIPLRGANWAAAESYIEQLRWDVIEAQRHSRRRLWITPFDGTQPAQAVGPSEIKQVLLVDLHATSDATVDAPAAGRHSG